MNWFWHWRWAGYPGLWLLLTGAAALAASLLLGSKTSFVIAGSLLSGWLWWRLMKNQCLNNWALVIFWVAFLGLLVNAIIQGGGPPVNKSPVAPKVEQGTERSIAQNYWPSAWGPSPQEKLRLEQQAVAEVAASAKPQGTWLWWWLCGASFLLALVSTPVALWDEIRSAYWWAVDNHQLRHQRISLEAPTTTDATATTTTKGNFWKMFQVFIPLEILSEVFGGFVERLIRRH